MPGQRWGGAPCSKRGGPAPTPVLSPASPLLPTSSGRWALPGGSYVPLMGPCCCSWAPLGSLGPPQLPPCTHPRGNAPGASAPAPPALTFPGHLLQSLTERKTCHVCDSLHPSPASQPCLQHGAHFLQPGRCFPWSPWGQDVNIWGWWGFDQILKVLKRLASPLFMLLHLGWSLMTFAAQAEQPDGAGLGCQRGCFACLWRAAG